MHLPPPNRDRILKALNVLHASTGRNGGMSAREIARRAGVSRRRILDIEHSAMEKVRQWAQSVRVPPHLGAR